MDAPPLRARRKLSLAGAFFGAEKSFALVVGPALGGDRRGAFQTRHPVRHQELAVLSGVYLNLYRAFDRGWFRPESGRTGRARSARGGAAQPPPRARLQREVAVFRVGANLEKVPATRGLHLELPHRRAVVLSHRGLRGVEAHALADGGVALRATDVERHLEADGGLSRLELRVLLPERTLRALGAHPRPQARGAPVGGPVGRVVVPIRLDRGERRHRAPSRAHASGRQCASSSVQEIRLTAELPRHAAGIGNRKVSTATDSESLAVRFSPCHSLFA